MKSNTLKKSSLTLMKGEMTLIQQLKKILKLPSNTAIVRLALQNLQKMVAADQLRHEFAIASKEAIQSNAQDMLEWDQIDDGVPE